MIITYHMTVDLAWALRRTTAELKGMLRHETGEPLTGWDVRRRLREAQSQGYTVLPCCNHVNATGHCRGHEDGQTPPRDERKEG